MAPIPPGTSFPFLTLDHVKLERAGRCLLSDISLTLTSGEALILTGPNGAGKSSFLRLLAGLSPLSAGTLTRKADVAWLGPDDALKPTLTVEQNLRLFTPHDTEAIHAALNQLGLTHLLDCPVRLLSLGQKRRVALSRLLLSDAPLWLLDEPANALDTASSTLLEGICRDHRARGGALIMASHTSLDIPGSHHLIFGRAPSYNPSPDRDNPAPRWRPAAIQRRSSPFMSHLRRELYLAFRNRTDNLTGLLFLILCGILFPLALGPTPALLQQAGPGILWVCTLLACLLPLERLYNADADDGSLDILQITLHPALIALGKILIHWLTSGLPIILATPLLAIFFQLPLTALPVLLGSLTLGSLTLAFIGGMTAAITLGARRSNLLLPLLTLPLMTPSLIFGTLACTTPAGPTCTANLSLLAAIFLLALPGCPLLAGASLRDAQS